MKRSQVDILSAPFRNIGWIFAEYQYTELKLENPGNNVQD